jgi:ABC-type sugar transport system ATPase subunit
MKILTGVYMRDGGVVEVDGEKVNFDGYRTQAMPVFV